MKPLKRRSSVTEGTLIGGTSLSFSTLGLSSSTFVVGSEGGALLRCNLRSADTDLNYLESKFSKDAIEILSRIETGARLDLQTHLEKHARLNNMKVVEGTTIFDATPPMEKIYPTASNFAFQPHIGPVHSVSSSPVSQIMFFIRL